jgi:hypothetical protein
MATHDRKIMRGSEWFPPAGLEAGRTDAAGRKTISKSGP